MDTTDLTSYIPGYDEYCEPVKERPDEDMIIDMIIDEMLEEESEENGISKED